MRKIKVLHVVSNMGVGGIQSLLVNIYENIDANKYEFIFLCYEEQSFEHEAQIISKGGKVIKIMNHKTTGLIKYIKTVAQVINEHHIDIVHIHVFFFSIFALLATKIAGVNRTIVHSHGVKPGTSGAALKIIYYKISRSLISLMSAERIACSVDAGNALFTKNNFTVIKNGIPLEKFRYNLEDRTSIRNSLNIHGESLVLLHVARLSVEKNQSFLLKVFKYYLLTNGDAKLIIVGDGPLMDDLVLEANNLKIHNNVLFIGSKMAVSPYYSAADIFILPSYYEGLGIVLIEAQVNGLPCIVSDGIPREADLGSNLTVIPLKSHIKVWSDALKAQRNTRYSNGYALAKGSDYNVAQTAKEITSIYLELMASIRFD